MLVHIKFVVLWWLQIHSAHLLHGQPLHLARHMGIKLVTPFTASLNNHSKLLDLVNWTSRPNVPPPVCLVPVPEDFDPSPYIAENDRKIDLATASTDADLQRAVTGESSLSTRVALDAEKDESPDDVPDNCILLQDFTPKNRLEQLLSVLFADMPALKRKYVAKIITLLLQGAPPSVDASFVFAVSEDTLDGRRRVFVRLPTLQSAYWLLRVSQAIIPDTNAIANEALVALLPTVEALPSSHPQANDIKGILANKNLYDEGSTRTGTEDLDEVMQYYKTYKVENSELVEVPKELKEIIVKDIIHFRSKVLSLERDARKKEIENERRKAKARLTQIFNNIKATKSAPKVTPDVEMAESSEQLANETSSYTEMSDEDYEHYLKKKALDEENAAYAAKLEQVKTLESTEKDKLIEQLNNAQTYEDTLIDNKVAYMDEMKQYLELATIPNSAPAAIMKLYYTDRRAYFRARNVERLKEERLDGEDRVAENSEASEKPPVESSQTGASSEAPSKLFEKTNAAVLNIVLSLLPPLLLESFKSKIGDLIEEYLGIREDVLIEFVNDFLMEHNFSKNEELIAELQETLDEDSTSVVTQLQEFAKELMRI